MINCEYRHVQSSNSDSDRAIFRGKLPAVPLNGETVNINGDPFVVIERGWAIDSGEKEMWCYIRVVSHHTDRK